MTSFSLNSIINSTLVEVFCKYALNITNYFSTAINLVSLSDSPNISSRNFLTVFETLHDFDEFQLKLLKGFLFVLVCNIFLICIFWRIYGKRICERFMKPATSKAIEELKASVSKLKLPKEHSPRL